MRYGYQTPEERRLRIAVVLLSLVVVVLCILFFKGCSDKQNDNNGEEPGLTTSGNVVVLKDTIVTSENIIVILKYLQVAQNDVIVIRKDTKTIPKTEYKGTNSGSKYQRSYANDAPAPKNGITGDKPVYNGNTKPNVSTPTKGTTEKYSKKSYDKPHKTGRNTPQNHNGNDKSPDKEIMWNPPPVLPENPADGGYIWIVLLIVLFIFYIIARVISRVGFLVIWAGPFDKFLVFAAAVLFFVSCLFDGNTTQVPHGIVITFRSIAGALMLWSVILSIIANLPSLLNIIMSILAKVFVFYCINFGLILLIVALIISFMFRASRRNYYD